MTHLILKAIAENCLGGRSVSLSIGDRGYVLTERQWGSWGDTTAFGGIEEQTYFISREKANEMVARARADGVHTLNFGCEPKGNYMSNGVMYNHTYVS